MPRYTAPLCSGRSNGEGAASYVSPSSMSSIPCGSLVYRTGRVHGSRSEPVRHRDIQQHRSQACDRFPAQLIEAATAAGCTRRQTLLKVQFPIALPEIMLGINQTIMLALSMLVITALVGTRDLSQEFSQRARCADAQGTIHRQKIFYI